MSKFDKVKADAMLWAFVAVNLAMARQIARSVPDPAEAALRMREMALDLLADSADVVGMPAAAIARNLVETVFLQ